MAKLELSDKDILNFALQNDIIDIDTIKTKIEMNERNKFLKKHPYKIWKGKDGNWHTYLPDEKKGRISRKKATKARIEDCVIEYWKEHSEENERKKAQEKMTLKKIFPIWIKQKQIHSKSSSSIKRILCDWNRFYVPQKQFINKPICEFTQLELDNWAHTMIKEYSMTKKMYYNMSTIVRQCFDLAASEELKCIPENTFRKFKVNSKLFAHQKKKTSCSQVYTLDEQIKLLEEMKNTFRRDPTNTVPLAVMLWFELGVRVAEICGMRFSDIEMNHVSIQRQVVVTYKFVDDYTMKYDGFEIAEYTKSEESYRDIYLTNRAREIIDLVRGINDKNGENNEGYIFTRKHTFIRAETIERTIERACKRADIPYKSGHKIRKTYISTLIDSGLNIDEIRRMVGHSDERTTYGNYCFNRLTDVQTQNAIENALDIEKVIKSNQNLSVISV
ncbi:MAG: tyrosine-type recombinase/integrase [Eubacterium sp.]